MHKNILILEDNEIQAKKLETIIKNAFADIQIFYATNVSQAKRLLNIEIIFDAFFLDISLQGEKVNRSGLIFAKQLQSTPRYKKTPILFITAFPEHIYSAVNNLHCFAYILKPYSEKEILQQLTALFQSQPSFSLKTSENIYIRLPLDSLQYIRSNGRYLTFVTASDSYRSRQYTLKSLLQMLSAEFVQCHKSYIINLTHVKNFDFVNHYAHMTVNDDVIPLSRKFHL